MVLECIPAFHELHVISDLHIGGVRGFQIFDQSATLEALLELLQSKEPNREIGLVINGDLVDFLAEPNATYFDAAGAAAKLQRIFSDPGFEAAWRGLTKFVQTPNRCLILTLGNHDLELALPWVREALLQKLTGADDAARGRVTFAFEGAGYRCRVGNANVLCVHGNEVDTWNVTDFEMLRRFGRDAIQGRDVDKWIPNAGSEMVIDVMNDIKRRFPFVDLLKPEQEAVVPILMALDHTKASRLAQIAVTTLRLGRDSVRRATGFLNVEEDNPASESDAQILDLLLARTLGTTEHVDDAFDALLDKTEERLRSGIAPVSLIAGDQRAEYLTKRGALVSWLLRRPVAEVVRKGLESLKKDRSFDPKYEDATFRKLDEMMGKDLQILIAGHTHLERALKRRQADGFYYNSGTWARLIRLENAWLDSDNKFAAVFAALKEGTMEALDNFPNLVQRRPAVVSVWENGSATRAELFHAGVVSGAVALTPVAGSSYVRS